MVLLDVGPQMGDLLEPASKALSGFIQGKVRPSGMHNREAHACGTPVTHCIPRIWVLSRAPYMSCSIAAHAKYAAEESKEASNCSCLRADDQQAHA